MFFLFISFSLRDLLYPRILRALARLECCHFVESPAGFDPWAVCFLSRGEGFTWLQMHMAVATADPHGPRTMAEIATVPCNVLRVSIPLPPVDVLASLPTGKCYMQESASRESYSCNVSVSIV